MTRTLVIGDPIFVLGPRKSVIEDGALLVEDRKVVATGRREDLLKMGPFDDVLGSPRHIVLPGFVNSHFHSTALLSSGLFELVFERANTRAARHVISEDDLHTAVVMNLIRAIRGGQTSAVDFSYGVPSLPTFGNEAILDAYLTVGMRVALGLVVRDQHKYVHGDDEAFLATLPFELASKVRASTMGYAWPVDDVLAAFERLAVWWEGREGRIRLLLAPDWTPSCSDELYSRSRRLADEYGTPITSHVLETRSEMIFNLRRYGKTAMRRLLDLGVLGPDFSCAHFVWATDEDIAILRDTGAVAVNNPGSNLRLHTGICRAADVFGSGKLAFGTDGISFSDEEDFFQEIRLAAYLQRRPGAIDDGRLPSIGLLEAAARNGAQALGQSDHTGSLEVGMDADLLVIDRDRLAWPAERYAATPIADVVLDRASAADIEHVMIAGQVVLRHRVVTTVDEAKVRTAFSELTRRNWEHREDIAESRQLALSVDPYVLNFYRSWPAVSTPPAVGYNVQSVPALSQPSA